MAFHRRQHLVLHTNSPQRTAQSQGVDHRRTHTHLIAFHTVEPFLGTRETTEDVTTTDHDTDLDTHLTDLFDLLCIITQALRVDAVALLTHQTLSREFQKNSVKSCHNL